jgi:hypothetical protein
MNFINRIIFASLTSLFLASCTEEENDFDISGTFNCIETPTGSASSLPPFQVTVLKESQTPGNFEINNFNNLGLGNVIYVVLVNQNIQLPQQTVSGFTFEGSGSVVNNGYFTMGYSIDDGSGTSEAFSATFTRN